MDLHDLLETARSAFTSMGFDASLIRGRVIDTGPQSRRAMALADQINAVRAGPPKQVVVLWTSDYAGVTLRGHWVYVCMGLSGKLSDDALAFVLAHEMAHHDLRHLTVHMGMAGVLGWRPQMELHADARALELCRKAGFSEAGWQEALSDELWDEEPEDPLEQWPEVLREWIRRHRRTHPPLGARRAALGRL